MQLPLKFRFLKKNESEIVMFKKSETCVCTSAELGPFPRTSKG